MCSIPQATPSLCFASTFHAEKPWTTISLWFLLPCLGAASRGGQELTHQVCHLMVLFHWRNPQNFTAQQVCRSGSRLCDPQLKEPVRASMAVAPALRHAVLLWQRIKTWDTLGTCMLLCMFCFLIFLGGCPRKMNGLYEGQVSKKLPTKLAPMHCFFGHGRRFRVSEDIIDSLSTKRYLQRKLKPYVNYINQPMTDGGVTSSPLLIGFEFVLQLTFGA